MIVVKVQGGLGNQLFHYAAAVRLAERVNNEIFLDSTYFDKEEFREIYRLKKFDMLFRETDTSRRVVQSSSLISRIKQKLFYKTGFFRWPGSSVIQGDQLTDPWKKLDALDKKKEFLLEGWLQKEDYVDGVKSRLSKDLWLKKDIPVDQELKNRIRNSNAVALHIRRGDMAKNPNFKTVGTDYYSKAVVKMHELVTDPHFFIFSDEPEKAKEVLAGVSGNFTYLTAQSMALGYYGTQGDYIDFELMRLCKHYITANSTFSWWPAFLSDNPDKVVIAPGHWYQNQELQEKFSKTGLLQKDWIIY